MSIGVGNEILLGVLLVVSIGALVLHAYVAWTERPR